MHLKLGFVILLIVYHLKNHRIFKQMQNDDVRHSSRYMRIWNEGATLLLFAIIFLVVLRNTLNWIYGLIGIIALGIILMVAIKLYKRIREKNPEV